jgi:hypothetical protein
LYSNGLHLRTYLFCICQHFPLFQLYNLGKFNAIQHGIDTESNRPVKQRIRRTPLGFAGEETQLKKMLGMGVIRP